MLRVLARAVRLESGPASMCFKTEVIEVKITYVYVLLFISYSVSLDSRMTSMANPLQRQKDKVR